jgi:UDP-N-acetyl-D-mannosaminuronate dehydrogenase
MVNPGATRVVVLPIPEKESRLKVDRDLYLVHCPERIDSGNKNFMWVPQPCLGGILKAVQNVHYQLPGVKYLERLGDALEYADIIFIETTHHQYVNRLIAGMLAKYHI